MNIEQRIETNKQIDQLFNSALASVSNAIVRSIVCNDGTVYCVGQGLALTDTPPEDMKLSDCPERVILFGIDDKTQTYDIYGCGRDRHVAPNIRISIPKSDIIQINYATRKEYWKLLVENWG